VKEAYKTQALKLWKWLGEHDGLTSMEAMLNPELGIGRLASRVNELRYEFDPPFPVKDRWVEWVNHSGKRVRVKFYYRERAVKEEQITLGI
jgi:Helix-turn-helix domain